ncbi:MAG: hypothetical protein ACQEQO_05235 [Thermodesulfobacteriota bacterium]
MHRRHQYVEKQHREIPPRLDSKVLQVAVGVYCIIWVKIGQDFNSIIDIQFAISFIFTITIDTINRGRAPTSN